MKENTMRSILKAYLEKNENVTSKMAIHYIQNECGIETSKEYIKNSFYNLREELHYKKIREKRNGKTLKEVIEEYVIKHGNCVSNDEVIKYITQECKIETTKSSITSALYLILKETGGTLKKEKRVTLKQIIYQYVLEHNKYVSRKEVAEYVFSLGIETTRNSIYSALKEVLNEQEGYLRRNSKKEFIKEYIKSNKEASIEEIYEYLKERGIKTTPEYIYYVLKYDV